MLLKQQHNAFTQKGKIYKPYQQLDQFDQPFPCAEISVINNLCLLPGGCIIMLIVSKHAKPYLDVHCHAHHLSAGYAVFSCSQKWVLYYVRIVFISIDTLAYIRPWVRSWNKACVWNQLQFISNQIRFKSKWNPTVMIDFYTIQSRLKSSPTKLCSEWNAFQMQQPKYEIHNIYNAWHVTKNVTHHAQRTTHDAPQTTHMEWTAAPPVTTACVAINLLRPETWNWRQIQTTWPSPSHLLWFCLWLYSHDRIHGVLFGTAE